MYKEGTLVMVNARTRFPKGTKGKIVDYGYVGNTKRKIFCVQTNEEIEGFSSGIKSSWFSEDDIEKYVE